MYIKRKNRIPEINSSASADIAFLLLIFFLLTTSLEKTKGIYRRLPPVTPEQVVIKKEDILKRDLLSVFISSDNQIKIGEELIPFSDLKNIIGTFIDNPENEMDLPEKIQETIPLLGVVDITKNHVIVLRISENANYETYISALNEIVSAYNELREMFSHRMFGKSYKFLNLEQCEAVRLVYPQKISETIIKEGK